MKKVLLAMLVCVIGICCMSIGVSAEDSGTCGDNLTWTYEDGTLTISGTGTMASYDSDDAPWYSSYKSSITTVVIKDGVTSIGNYAFFYCTNLTSITIPDSVTSIGKGAFWCCTSLTSVTIPNGVISIGSWAFYTCSSLTSIIISGSVTFIGDCAFDYCSKLTTAHYLGSEDNVTIGSNNSYLTNAIHYMIEVEETTYCTKEGNIAYYSCDDCDTIIYIDDNGNYATGTIDDVTLTATGHTYEYVSNEDGTHMITCANDCGYAEEKNCTYDSGVLSDDGTYYTYTCEYCRYYYTEDVEEEEDEDEEEEDTDDEEDNTDEEEDSTEDTDSEEATDDTTDDSNTDDTDSEEDTDDTSDSTDTDTSTSDSTTTSSTYTNAYIQYIGGILMSGNTSTSTVEDVSTGAGMTAEGSAGGSALAVVSLLGVAVVISRKRR